MRLDLLLFASNPVLAGRAAELGVDGVVLDLEVRGKHDRQADRDTQIAVGTPADVPAIRAATPLQLVVRINGVGPDTAREVEEVLKGGADEVLVPMVRTTDEIDEVLGAVRGRAHVSCMVETVAALSVAGDFAARPVHRFYVGLNDLAIDRGTDSIFDPLVDGSLESLVGALAGRPFGVAGLTDPALGSPLPCQLILDELVRLGASFTFLRRSFLADAQERDPTEMVAAIRAAVRDSAVRDAATRGEDHAALVAAVGALRAGVL